MTEQQQRKQTIRAFFVHYTDERLAMLLAHARDGKLTYHSCCCFIGASTADHALKQWTDLYMVAHWARARQYPDAAAAERAYGFLDGGRPAPPGTVGGWGDDEKRRRILIPIIRAEMKRRELARTPAHEAQAAMPVEG